MSGRVPAAGAFNQAGAAARRLRARTSARAARLQRVYAGCAALTCLLWLVLPVAQRARGRSVEFPFWLGVDYSSPAAYVPSRLPPLPPPSTPLSPPACCRFAAVMLYSYYVTTLVGIANTTMDAFMATVLYQCKTQLTILRSVIRRLRIYTSSRPIGVRTLTFLSPFQHEFREFDGEGAGES